MTHKTAISYSLIDLVSPNPPANPWIGFRWLECVSLTDWRAKYPLVGYWEWDGLDWRGEKHYEKTISLNNAASGDGVYFPTPMEADRLKWSIRSVNYAWYVQSVNDGSNYYQMRLVSRNTANTETVISEVSTVSQGTVVANWRNSWNRTPSDFSIDTTNRRVMQGRIVTAFGTPGAFFGSWVVSYNYLRP